ncbi:hypothetical protein M5K25_022162 [Dendrobium thyrsiflorum]|uniref:RNase H type-1 domain-containing protein n=1 Tax=Dendrobium thyrsiflorum TaxID=117978 RepID=A0ABD0U674_DENTH
MFEFDTGFWGVNQPDRVLKNSWQPPPPEWIKVNVDVCLKPMYKPSIGGVFRDHKGRFLLAFGFGRLHWDIYEVELLAVHSLSWFLQKWMLEYKWITVEGDNVNVIKFLQGSPNKSNGGIVDNQLEDLTFLKDFNYVIFNHVNRDCNKLADFCANTALSYNFIWGDFRLGSIPPFFLLLKEECDAIGSL